MNTREIIFGILLLLIMPSISLAQTSVPQGDVSGTWTKTGSPYQINGDITIPDDNLLEIEPGVVVEFQGYYRMNVLGTVRAIGTVQEKITITVNDTNGYSNPDTSLGSWYGIIFNNSPSGANGAMFDNDTSIFNNCVIEYGKRSQDSGDDFFYALIYMHNYSKVKFVNCEIHHCTSRSNLFKCYFSSPEFRNNRITNCNAGEMIQLIELGNALITGNYISNNKGKGLSIAFSSPQIINNVIVNNSSMYNGAGMYLTNSAPVLINNTICNNYTNSSGGGLYIRGSEPKLFNNIIWGNSGSFGNQIYLDDENLSPDIYYCDIEGGIAGFGGQTFTGAYENNIESDPLFEQESGGAGEQFDGVSADWSLQNTSPCLNAGTSDGITFFPDQDYVRNNRIKYGEVDIGAIEFSQDYITASVSIASDVTWIADTVKVLDHLTIENGNTLQIAAGAVIEFQDRYRIEVEGTLVAEGTLNEKILFTAKDTSYFYVPDSIRGGWLGTRFNETAETNDTSRFSHCIFEFGKVPYEFSSGRYGGAIYTHKFSNLIISACEFRNNMAERGGALWISNADIKLSNCLIHGNHALLYGGGVALSYSNASLNGNEILNNYCGLYGGGIYAGGKPATPSIMNCVVYNNYGKYGGGTACFTNALFSNNTICNNQANTGGGILLYSCKPLIYNSILWGNQTGFSSSQLISWFQASPFIYNCDIQDGLAGIGTIGEGVYQDNIDVDPSFRYPSVSIGQSEELDSIDWSLTDFSACIDMGVNLAEIPAADFHGNKRVNNSIIDLGAIENQAAQLQIIKHPQNTIKCESDPLLLYVSVSDTAMYQWLKDGDELAGATSASLDLNPLKITDQGNYVCLVSNAYGTIESNPAYVMVNEKPEFLSDGQSVWAEPGKHVILSLYYKGTNPGFTWEKDEAVLPGETLPELDIVPNDSSSEGNYRAIISNSCGIDTSETICIYLAPQICMVTVSPTTGHNLVVWEKKTKAPIMAYHIYRESVAAGIYDRLATIPFDDLSVFVDTMADPTVQAYLYKITALDTAGIETDIDLCKPHKTIHLLVTTNPELNTTQLAWDRYYGFDYLTYTIYRSSTGVNFDPVHSLSASLNSWTDPDPSAGDLFYRIAVEKPDPCIPEGGDKKAGTGPYHHSLSNMDDNKLKAGQLPPDTITLSKNTIEEENLPGGMIGKLFTEDQDSLDSHTYKFVPGNGDNDNISFSILSDLLLASESYDYETKNQYSVRIRSTDEAGNYCEVPFIIQVLDIDETTGLPVLNTGAVKAFPNPFSRSTTIIFPNPSGDTYRMVLMDLSGKACRIVDEITTSEYVLEKTGLKEGFYIIEMRGPKVHRCKIVIE